jgi:hypothetical protein
MNARAFAYTALGLSALFILASLTVLAGLYPRNIIVLGIGVVLLSSALVYLQLSYWREGEVRNTGRTEAGVHAVTREAPSELRNPHWRRIWENMEESRRLMEIKEKEHKEAAWDKEKQRLGLSHDEDILFMEETSWLAFGPLAIVSAIALMVSTYNANPIVSFLCLALGLGGLLLMTQLKGRTRYYLTNFRVLVRERPFLSGRTRWSSLPYSAVQQFSLEHGFGRRTLMVEGNKKRISVRGLTGATLLVAVGILRENIPAITSSSFEIPEM